MAVEIPPPSIVDPERNFKSIVDYKGVRFLERIDTIVILDGDQDSTYTGYQLPFLKKGLKIEIDKDLHIELSSVRKHDKYVIQEVKTKENSDTKFFKRIKKIASLNDLKGFVRIRSAYEALEFLRFTTSPIVEINFPGMREVYCVSNFEETAPEFRSTPVASTEECRQMRFSSPEGSFDLVIADVKVKIKGTHSFGSQPTLDQLVESLKRTTTGEKEIKIEVEEIGQPIKVKTKGSLTSEEQSLVASITDQIRRSLLKIEIEIEAEVDEKKVPPFFVITRTVYSRVDRGFTKVTEEVGQDGSWRIVDKKMIVPLTNENFKYYSR